MGGLAEMIAKLMTSSVGRDAAKSAARNAPLVLAPSTLDRLQKEYLDEQKKYNEQLKKNTKHMQGVINNSIAGGMIAGAGTNAAIRNDSSGLATIGSGLASVGSAASAAGSALMMLGPTGMVVGGVVKAFGIVAQVAGAAIHAIDQLSKAILARAEELMRYSPSIAIAKAQNIVKLQQADMREAQTLGPDMARLMEAKTDVDISIRDILLPIKKVIVELMADFFEFIRDFLEENKELFITIAVTIGESLKIIIELLQFHVTEAGKLIAGLPKKIADALNDINKEPIDIWKDLKENAMKDMLPPATPNPAAPPHNMLIPAF